VANTQLVQGVVGYDMTAGQLLRRIVLGSLLAQYGAGKDRVESEFRLQIDLNGQLVAAVPHAKDLARLHHLLDIEQGGQGSASGIDHNRQGGVLANA